MAEGHIDPDLILPNEYKDLPLNALRSTARNKIGQFLNLEGTVVICLDDEGKEIDVSTNYNGLAELAGFDYLEIRNLDRHKNPTLELLDSWASREGYWDNATIGYLWKYLRLMEREDVLKDCRRVILSDCNHYKDFQQIRLDAERYNLEPVQDPTVSSGAEDMKIDETDIVALEDVDPALDGDAERITFDAFVCYCIEDFEDRQFVRNMIAEIEFKRGLKLFVPGRNDIPGAAQNSINAYLIEKRCRRVVILLSRTFLSSAVCDFQLKFAQCLAAGARSKRLIPILREKGTPIPRILRFLAVCDFTKSDMVDWVWERLGAAIRAPIGSTISDTSVELEESLKEVRFPTQQRRLHSDSDTRSSSSRTMRSRRQTAPTFPRRPEKISTSIQSRIEAFSNRRVSSFGGQSSRDSSVTDTLYSRTPPNTSSRASASNPIPINNRSNMQYYGASPKVFPSSTRSIQSLPANNPRPTNAVYPRAKFSPQEDEVKMEYYPNSPHEVLEMSTEEHRDVNRTL